MTRTNKNRKNNCSNKFKKTKILEQKELAATPYHRIYRFFWTLDLGPRSGMNDHPGKDTDVISRPSESTIKELSFYIGFTRIQSSIKHLGPCFGTNGHFRRDPDVISRLPDTTIDFLSVFIGFTSWNRVKMVVLDENIIFIWFFIDKLKKIEILFCSGDHSKPFLRSKINWFLAGFLPGIFFGPPKSGKQFQRYEIMLDFFSPEFFRSLIIPN